MLNRLFVKRHIISISIVVFIVFYSIINYVKPSFLYHKNGSLREFGIGYKNKTIIPVWLLSILLAILSYFSVSYYLAMPRLKY